MRGCDVHGCPRPHEARGLCKQHYNNRRKSAVCEGCGDTYMRSPRARTNYCPPCAEEHRVAKVAAYQRAAADDRRIHWPASRVFVRNCPTCSTLFVAKRESCAYCSDDCQREMAAVRQGFRGNSRCGCGQPRPKFKTYCDDCRRAMRRRYANAGHDRDRARRYGRRYESVSRRAIFERDHWRCGICGQTVDKNLQYPDPMSASLDHIVPLARGGDHAPANVQLAHLRCNVRKGADRCQPQQLAVL